MALPLAEKAVALTPELPLYLDTLALVYYRLGNYRPVAELLERSQRDRDATPASDLFLLAMSYHQLNETAKARDYYERARQWCSTQTHLPVEQVEKLKSFQAEAEVLLHEVKP